MEAWGRTFLVTSDGRHIVGNEMLDDEVTVSTNRREWRTGRKPGAIHSLESFDAGLP
jgi:hypothetical protein